MLSQTGKPLAVMASHPRWSRPASVPYEVLCLRWKGGAVPQEMRDAIIITFYKNKGDRLDCNIYRGISVMSIIGKIFARVLLTRLQALVDRIYPEFQCGFRAERSTDMIFTVRQLQKKSPEQGKPLYLAFSDLTKAFDLVSRKGLFQLLEKIGCTFRLYNDRLFPAKYTVTDHISNTKL